VECDPAFCIAWSNCGHAWSVFAKSFHSYPTLYSYSLGAHKYDITVVNLVIGVLIIIFALMELLPAFSNLTFDRRYLPLGGSLSGFFGGISGNQGALRSTFLIKAGLDKEAYIGTGTVSGVIVDAARLIVYGLSFYTVQFAEASDIGGLVMAATVAAFLGALIGARLVKKVTLRAIQLIVGTMLVIVGFGMATGLF
jgi:uncharacterized protein